MTDTTLGIERFQIECGDCGGSGSDDDRYEGDCWNCCGLGYVHEDPRLKGRKHCAACGRRYSWGCGHTQEHESAALDHQASTVHLLGDCDCYESRPGYAAFVTRGEQRERVATVLRMLDDETTTVAALLGVLYGR